MIPTATTSPTSHFVVGKFLLAQLVGALAFEFLYNSIHLDVFAGKELITFPAHRSHKI